MILLQPPTYILLELHMILISLIIYKPSTLIISPQTFSMQLGAGTSLFCLSQCAIPFCTPSLPLSDCALIAALYTQMGPRIEAIYLVILLFLFHIIAIVVTSIHCLSCFVHSVIQVLSTHQCLQHEWYSECICPSMTSCRYLLLCK